ncbi:MAG: type I polyketide synthase, partial [Acidobacteria bacterium]|nr:type I polyketide synthase [Acidobacteriota bacterium]
MKQEDYSNAVAIIGMAGRFPGARDTQAFWQGLRDGVESISFFTDEMLLKNGTDPSWLKEPNYVKARGVLEDIDLFDAEFFGMNPREASITDPQHRIFLECACEALDHAGCNPDTYEGLIAVFAGQSMSSYLVHLYLSAGNEENLSPVETMVGNDKDFLSSRIAYKLNLRGPAITVQTSCSTSLDAIHLASQSLLAGECDLALAGGVSVSVPQVRGYFYDGGINSPDGHCRAFDAHARGTIDGSGAGVVALKRMPDAVRDRDHVLAVILGSAINNDGSRKVGYTAPSVEGQARVIADALAVAGVDPSTISYVEAHGTGTVLGDPIEVAALTQAYRARTDRRQYCAIGSVKTNIGHLDAAAGVAGLIKTVLALRHRELPPSLHYREPNPKIDFAASPFYVNAELREWAGGETPRRAAVSSFGIGGTNAHAVLEEAPAREASGQSREWQVLTLSAKSGRALEQMRGELSQRVAGVEARELADIAYTLQVGRKSFPHRYSVVCRDGAQASRLLAEGGEVKEVTERRSDAVAFVFTGQGTQYVGMGAELYEKEKVYRQLVDKCAQVLRGQIGYDIREVLYPKAEKREWAEAQLSETRVTQPAIFVVEYALAELLRGWGLEPGALIGHSVGEYVAACVSGVMELEECLKVVAMRGELMQRMKRGAMAAVMLSAEELEERIWEGLDIAAENGAGLSVVAGRVEEIEELERRLEGEGVGYRRLRTSHAFHSW